MARVGQAGALRVLGASRDLLELPGCRRARRRGQRGDGPVPERAWFWVWVREEVKVKSVRDRLANFLTKIVGLSVCH